VLNRSTAVMLDSMMDATYRLTSAANAMAAVSLSGLCTGATRPPVVLTAGAERPSTYANMAGATDELRMPSFTLVGRMTVESHAVRHVH
jgi:hypothetical protein